MQMLLSSLMKVQGRNQGGLVSACSMMIFIVALAVLVGSVLVTGLSCTQRQGILVRCKFYCQKENPAAEAREHGAVVAPPQGSAADVRLAEAVNCLIHVTEVD